MASPLGFSRTPSSSKILGSESIPDLVTLSNSTSKLISLLVDFGFLEFETKPAEMEIFLALFFLHF